jgi:hypothetical protein
VFFNGTCTPTESVYLNVTGVLQLPQGDFRDSELQNILLESFSSYLNFSKEFITIIIYKKNEDIGNATDTNVTNASTRVNTYNSSSSRRRLLYDLTVERFFTALFQIGLNDNPTYVKVNNFINDTKNAIQTITDANGYRIVMQQVDLTPGYFNAAGTALSRCDDGQYPVPDAITKKLECKAKVIVEVAKKVAQETSAYWIAMIFGVLVLAVCILIHFCRKGQNTLPTGYEPVPSELTRYCAQEFGGYTKALQVPATVAIEYRLLPGQSI